MGPLLARRCASCHEGATPAGGWNATSYLQAIGCVASDGHPATESTNPPLLAVLARPSHAAILTADERGLLARWIAGGAPAFRGGVHDASFVDPRSTRSHGRFLRARQWRPMLDPHDDDACGACHEGAPARSSSPPAPAPGATPCTTCHVEANGLAAAGPLGCNICHGGPGGRAFLWDACFFPGNGAHSAHVSPKGAVAVACATCHAVPRPGDSHPKGTGAAAVRLSGLAAHGGLAPTYDRPTTTCANVYCHSLSGATVPNPQWTAGSSASVCGACHGLPPRPPHTASPACGTSLCHAGSVVGGALTPAGIAKHVDGNIDLSVQ